VGIFLFYYKIVLQESGVFLRNRDFLSPRTGGTFKRVWSGYCTRMIRGVVVLGVVDVTPKPWSTVLIVFEFGAR
jgi:hypothetical protein